jgi:galactose mutarotase-like enzyme
MNTSQLEGIDTVTLSAGSLQAEFAPALGMAGVSLRHEGDELLDRQAGLLAYASTGAVMGVPLLYPWANRLAGHDYMLDGRDVRLPSGPPLVHCEEHGLPVHGLLHASPYWRATSRAETRMRATFDFGAHAELLGAFPFPHTLDSRRQCRLTGCASRRRSGRRAPRRCRSRSAFTPTSACPASRALDGR